MAGYKIIGNRYIVVKSVGEGGMADVYLAVDKILRREVAVKVLRGELNNDPVNLKRFQREASAITNLSHPNIVEVYDVGEDNNKNYIVMEYVAGKTLKQLIKQRGALNPDEAINIMKQLVSATDHAHQNGIIHRDIKSQNVLIKDDGTVKLSDFGIAFTGDSQQLTQTDTVMGSVHYLAPELAKGQLATVQSDIYSLGIVFFEMLTGDVPFHADTAVQIALKHMHDMIPSVRAFNNDIPQSVENLIIRATAKDPALRYESAKEMYDDLVTCLDISRMKEPKLVLQPQKPQTHSEAIQVKRKKKDHGSIFVVFAAILLCLSIFLMLAALSGKLMPEPEKVTMPNLVGYQLEDADRVIKSYELVVESIKYETTDNIPKGQIIRTSPTSNTEIEKGGFVILYVSNGVRVTIQNYVGMDYQTIKNELTAKGFTVSETYKTSVDRDPGIILEQNVEEGTVFEPTDVKQIHFVVSSEPSFMIPTDLEDKPIAEAKATLEKLGAKVSLKQLPAEGNMNPETGEYIHPLGVVVNTSPVMGTYYTQTKNSVIVLEYY